MATHRGHGLGHDPATEQWVADDKEWGLEDLDDAVEDRRPVLLEWLKTVDVPHHLRTRTSTPQRLSILRRLLAE